jgi:hypothetical protein
MKISENQQVPPGGPDSYRDRGVPEKIDFFNSPKTAKEESKLKYSAPDISFFEVYLSLEKHPGDFFKVCGVV